MTVRPTPCSSVSPSSTIDPSTLRATMRPPSSSTTSPENVFDPPSTVTRPSRLLLTTVVRIESATSCGWADPFPSCIRSLNT